MTRIASMLLAVVISAAGLTTLVARQSAQVDKLFASAQHKETVEGDLQGAIESYQLVVSQAGSNRALAARALLRIADCHQKLGSAQSRAVYERIVREYGDQTDAVVAARARLGATAGASGDQRVVNRQIWTGQNVIPSGAVSPDGRYLAFVDWESEGNLAIRDLTNGTNRRLTNSATMSAFAEQSAISHDGMQVAYAWFSPGDNRYQLRVVRTTPEPSLPTPRVLVDNPEISWIGPFGWSPDGRWITAAVGRADNTMQIALVSAADGTIRPLKSVDWRGPSMLALSPDGQSLAYDMASESDTQRDIHLLSVDGSREVALVTHPADDVVVGWTPDGRSLLFKSDRAGISGLWSIAVADGRAAGTPTLLNPDMSRKSWSFGITRTGTLVYAVNVGARNVHVAEVDFATGRTLSQPRPITDSYLFSEAQPDWSADGRTLVFKSERPRASALAVMSLDSGRLTEVRPKLAGFNRVRWAPDGSVVVQGNDLKGRYGIYRVDLTTGDISALVTGDPGSVLQASWTPDGRQLVYRRYSAGKASVVARDVASGTEREIFSAPNLAGVTVSPDGRLATYVNRESGLSVVPLAGGPSRTLYKPADQRTMLGNFVEWTPDGRRVLFVTAVVGDFQNQTIWSIPATGGTPVPLDLKMGQVGGYFNPRIHPDGKRIAFTAGEGRQEVWTLENFLPATRPR